MDVFCEQLLKRKDRPVEKAMKVIIVAIAGVVVALCLTITVLRIFGAISGLFVPLAFGVGIATFFYIRSLYIEYEYSLTNGEFDIDKIIGRSKRKSMYSFKLREVEEFGIYDNDKERLANRQFDFRVSPVNFMDKGLYYCIVRDNQHGVGLVILQPNDKIKDGMKIFLPRQVQGDVLSRD